MPVRSVVLLVPFLVAACGTSGPKATSTSDAGASRGADAAHERDAAQEKSVDAGETETDAGHGPWPLGATYDPVGKAFHFRIRSARATRLELSLFDQPLDAPAKLTVAVVPEATGNTWDATVKEADVTAAGVGATVYYGYRAWGPNWTYDPSFTPGSAIGFVTDVDDAGNRFNPNKLLIDPYTHEISQDPLSPGHVDSSVYAVGTANRTKDSATSASKGIVLTETSYDFGTKPVRSLADDIVYEVHVRGLTMNDPSADPACVGTYAAAGAKAAYLATLGVTTIELLPIEETQNDTNDLEESSSGDNYWGYSTLAFLAPDRRYACDRSPGGPTREFAAMVKALHEKGLKVFLDVVYNHTAEGGGASLLSWRGLDDASYYELSSSGQGFTDNTGIGANFNVANPIARDLVLDSLQYWTSALGVDGFRFDLAPVLGNTCTVGCFDFSATSSGGILLRALTELPKTTLIAEPWAIGNGTYQLGAFPPGWSEWNGQFRDTIRTVQNEQGVTMVTPATLSSYLSGSPNVFAKARGPIASINYIVSHDGFTLHDEYACDAPDNDQPWPYGPSTGGTTDNLSWDQAGDPDRQELAARTGLSLLAVAAGVPMITGGDEIGRTILCNNNPYNLDSIANWLDWPAGDTSLQAFATGMLAFRSAHASLRPKTFWDGVDHNGNGLKDVTWLQGDGTEAASAYLDNGSNTFLGFRVDGTEAGDVAASIYVAYNSGPDPVTVTVPAALKSWFVASDSDTVLSTGGYVAPAGHEPALAGGTYALGGRTVVVLIDR
jgi:isoamylase